MCDCAYCRGVLDGAALAVRQTEARMSAMPPPERVAGLLSCAAFYVRELRKLSKDHRVVVAQGVRDLLDVLAAGDPS